MLLQCQCYQHLQWWTHPEQPLNTSCHSISVTYTSSGGHIQSNQSVHAVTVSVWQEHLSGGLIQCKPLLSTNCRLHHSHECIATTLHTVDCCCFTYTQLIFKVLIELLVNKLCTDYTDGSLIMNTCSFAHSISPVVWSMAWQFPADNAAVGSWVPQHLPVLYPFLPPVYLPPHIDFVYFTPACRYMSSFFIVARSAPFPWSLILLLLHQLL